MTTRSPIPVRDARRAGWKWFLLPLFAATLTAAPVRVSFLYSDGNMPGTLRAFKALLAERPDLSGQLNIGFLTESVFDDVKPGELAVADVLVYDVMNQEMLDRYNKKI